MRLLDRYLLAEWLKILGMTVGAMVGLLLIGNIFDIMPDFLDWKTPGLKVLEFFLWQIPGFMPIVLPVAVLVSLLFILGHLHKNQEITAMRAAGLSVWRLSRVLWAGGAVCAALLLTVNVWLAPLATATAREIRERASFEFLRKSGGTAAPSDKFASILFDNGTDHRRWRIAQLGAYSAQASGIQVYELRADGTVRRQIFADFARFDPARGHWIFEHGRICEYDATGRDLIGDQVAFREHAEPRYTEQPLPMRLASKRPTELSIREIDTLIGLVGTADSGKVAALATRYHSLLAGPFACLIVVGLAIPAALAGVRVNPMVGVSKALGIYAAYYALDRVGYALGSQQHLPPSLAAWLPNLAALAFAAHLCRKVN